MGKLSKNTTVTVTLDLDKTSIQFAIGICIALLALILGCFAIFTPATTVIPILIATELGRQFGQLEVCQKLCEIRENNA